MIHIMRCLRVPVFANAGVSFLASLSGACSERLPYGIPVAGGSG